MPQRHRVGNSGGETDSVGSPRSFFKKSLRRQVRVGAPCGLVEV